MQPLLPGQLSRVFVGVVLVGLLFGSFVFAGATPGDPIEEEYPDERDVMRSPDAYVGERVILGGFVVETDPVVIATRASGYGRFTLVDAEARLLNADAPLERNDRVTAFGTLEDDSTLAVDRAMTRESGEERYMFAASLLGGLWVVGRFVRGWRFDRTTLAFAPRERRSAARDDRDGPDARSRPNADRSDRPDPSTDRSDDAVGVPSDGGDRRA
ncbi:hypothetical protein [Halosolutus gelatinilyticus]|uniref:hypothetical protein n=1 Tax=Halosolutus gelatinilyticus TaxID=2931975 RepID=UPI001FF2AFC3|nr:hypothetical protein [Halosolutus gelatinilyticus]